MDVAHIRELCLEAEGFWRQQELVKATACATAAVAAARDTEAPGPHHALGLALTTLGWLRFEVDPTAARTAFAEAVNIARALRGDDTEHALAILRHAADFEHAQGELAAARTLEQEGLALLGESLGTDHPRYFAMQERLTHL